MKKIKKRVLIESNLIIGVYLGIVGISILFAPDILQFLRSFSSAKPYTLEWWFLRNEAIFIRCVFIMAIFACGLVIFLFTMLEFLDSLKEEPNMDVKRKNGKNN